MTDPKQKALDAAVEKIKKDFGEGAVMRFQRDHGIPADGRVAERTRLLLLGEPPPPPSPDAEKGPGGLQALRRGDRGGAVSQIQTRLRKSGYFKGEVTGYFGPATEAAVRAFQSDLAIDAHGIVDERTGEALMSWDPDSAMYLAPPESHASERQRRMENPLHMHHKVTLMGHLAPKSIGHSGTGLFFVQNMMYAHTITVFDRNFRLVKTIDDAVSLKDLGAWDQDGLYRGAPVEVAFSQSGRHAWVTNYQMYGPGFTDAGSDRCSPSPSLPPSFVYRIDMDALVIDGAVRVGPVPKYIAITPDDRLVLVTNWCGDDLSVVDAARLMEIRRVPLGRYPRGIAVDGACRFAYVAVMGSLDVARVDLADFSVAWIKGVGRSLRHLVLSPQDDILYVTLNGDNAVARVSLADGRVTGRAFTGKAPRSMALSVDGAWIYVVNYHSDTVAKVRAADMSVVHALRTDPHPIGIACDPATGEVWVTCYGGSVMVLDG